MSETVANLNSVIITQGHHDIIPFSYMVDYRQNRNSTIRFSYETIVKSLPFNELLNFTSNVSVGTTTTFIPESEESKYKHEPIFYVDIISESDGVRQYSLRSQQEIYIKEDPDYVFNIPKFTWDNSIFGDSDESQSSEDMNEGYVWVGTSDKHIKKIYYNSESASLMYSTNCLSEVQMITIGQNDSSTFVSCYDHLVKYVGTSYFSGDDNFKEEVEIANIANELIVLDDKETEMIISVDTYKGKVIFRNRDTLDIVATYSGFDAPFKVVWSQFHNCYFVAGTHILWKLDGGVKSAIYTIRDYSIVDFDCSEKGILGVIFKGINDYVVRFLNNNLYSILYSEFVNDKYVRYCKYCQQGKFYVLAESNSGSTYDTLNYLFDSITGTMVKTESVSDIVTTTTTTTLPVPTNKIKIIDPISYAIWGKGDQYDIKWISSASVNDVVKIELYNGNFKIDTITSQTGNTGIYSWKIAETYEDGSTYKIKITWLAAGNESNYDISGEFSIVTTLPVTTTTTTKIVNSSIGVGYDKYNNQIVNVLNNGLVGIYKLEDNSFIGLFDSKVTDINCMTIKDRKVSSFNEVSKVRIFVGSEQYLSDKWDSGVVETNLSSMFYGNGDNLIPGNTYIVNIQVYSDKYGWSEIQSRSFTMPK